MCLSNIKEDKQKDKKKPAFGLISRIFIDFHVFLLKH